LALATNREFACHDDVHFSELGSLIDKVVRGFNIYKLPVACQCGTSFIGKVLRDSAGRKSGVCEGIGHRR